MFKIQYKQPFLKFPEQKKIVIDPHTAVGIAAERNLEIKNQPIIYVATAHASKIPETVHKVIKEKIPLPKKHKSLLKLNIISID